MSNIEILEKVISRDDGITISDDWRIREGFNTWYHYSTSIEVLLPNCDFIVIKRFKRHYEAEIMYMPCSFIDHWEHIELGCFATLLDAWAAVFKHYETDCFIF